MKKSLIFIFSFIIIFYSCANKKDNFLGKWIVCDGSEEMFEITKKAKDYKLSQFPYNKFSFSFRAASENLLVDETGLNRIRFDKENNQLIISFNLDTTRLCKENSRVEPISNLELQRDSNSKKELPLTFDKVMTYFSTNDENYILNDLAKKDFIIQSEQPSQLQIFDSQIICFKKSDEELLELMGVAIFKTAGEITALSYFTFDSTDFNSKIIEINKRDFIQKIKNPSTHWAYQKGDTLVTAEKKNVTIKNKTLDRYEISIIKVENKD